MMQSFLAFAALAVPWDQYPSDMSGDFTSAIEITKSGITHTGTVVNDASGGRSVFSNTDTEETVVRLVSQTGYVFTYSVQITQPSPLCNCGKLLDESVKYPWAMYYSAVKNGTCTGKKSGKKGTLYTLQGKYYPDVLANVALCQDVGNQGASAMPIYTQVGHTMIEYVDFRPGNHSRTAVNLTILDPFLPQCAQGCGH